MKILFLVLIFNFSFIYPKSLFNIIKEQIYLTQIVETELNGKEIKFARKRISNNCNRFYSLDNSYEYFYEDLVDLNGKIIGIVIEKFLKYIIIKLETGSYIKTILFQNTVNKGGFYFINDLNVIKSLMIDEYIWLKYSKDYYIKNNHDLTHNYLIAQNSILPNFKKYEKVKVIDVIPYIINDKNLVDFFLKVKTEDHNVLYIKYNHSKYRAYNQKAEYFNQMPIPYNLKKNIAKNLKKEKVTKNMTKFQVMVCWGKPLFIEKNIYGEKVYNYLEGKFAIYDREYKVKSYLSY